MRLRFSADDKLPRFGSALQQIGDGRARMVLARAVNHTGRKALTAVRRGLVQQTSAPRKAVVSATVGKGSATKGFGPISYVISAAHKPLSLKIFKPRQDASGVTAKVWRQNKSFRSAFIVQSLGGHVSRRVGRARLPIRQLYGPSMATELIKDESRAAFQRVIRELPPRVNHELARVLPK